MNQPASNTPHSPNRWVIALAGTWLQLFLGTVYAWSYFQKPLGEACSWKPSQVVWAFSLAICFLGLAAACGGLLLPRFGPRLLATVGGVLFGSGYLLAAVAIRLQCLPLLYLGYGVVGGIGLGLGYVTPVATVAKWFPDKKGLATGMVIMGFGFGALLQSKIIAPQLFQWTGGNWSLIFACMGVAFIPATLLAAALLRNPPADWVPPAAAGSASQHSPAKATPSAAQSLDCSTSGNAPEPEKLFSLSFAAIWIIFFCNITAGISIISFQSPIFQDLWRNRDSALSVETLASYGAWLIAVTAMFNGIGRIFWGALSDRIGRIAAFRLMLGTQVVVFSILAYVGNPWLFGAMICYILLCYGGGFGTMPSLVLDTFGARQMALGYGLVLTAWSAGGIAGPRIIAWLTDRYPGDAAGYSFFTSAGILAVGLVFSLATARKT